ncbi:hypothetical protein AAHC03_09100 [Spirometra sp. Aus1]
MARIGRGVQIGLSWVKTKPGDTPDGAIEVEPGIYVCRALYEGEQIPGKYIPAMCKAFVPYAGRGRSVKDCEVLCDTRCRGQSCCYQWVSASGGEVPEGAIVAGVASDGQPLYIAKAPIEEEICVGKVHSGHARAYMPSFSRELSVNDYEVLVWKTE